MTMQALYEAVFGLMVLMDIALLVAVPVAGSRWLYIKWKDYSRMSRSETIEADDSKIIYEIEDPFGDASGFPMNDGLKEARQWLAKMFKEGSACLCPACGQNVQKYRRQIYGKMVDAMEYISANPGAKSDRLRYFGGGDYAKLAYWGLIEQDAKKQWRCTPKGESFLAGEIMVPKYTYVYNAIVFGRSEEMVDVRQCRKGFALEETLTPPVTPELAEAI